MSLGPSIKDVGTFSVIFDAHRPCPHLTDPPLPPVCADTILNMKRNVSAKVQLQISISTTPPPMQTLITHKKGSVCKRCVRVGGLIQLAVKPNFV